jgi:cephalosporin-C deacetylase-like acetyl esterase
MKTISGKNRKRLIYFFLFACFFNFSITSFAQTDPAITLTVVPDHPDWLYKKDEPAVFYISLACAGKALKGTKLHIEIGQEKMIPSISKDIVLKNDSARIIAAGLKQAGFLRCTVSAEIDDKKYKALATAAYDPDSIKATAGMPPDFDIFWANAINAASKIPMDSRMRLLEEGSNSKIDVYEVSFQNFRIGSRIYGILCVPKKPGKYPAVLKVPGAGVRAYHGDTALAENGAISLEIGIHGVPVTMPDQVYYDLAFGPLNEYYFFNLDDRDQYYYKRVYLGCLRAIDFLTSLDKVDTSRIAVTGGSQGGALSIVTAALDNRVKYVAALYPALSDLTGYFYGRAGGWPHMFAPASRLNLKTPERIKTSGYYDVVNFSRKIKIPGIYSWGYNDEVCPPTSIYSSFNSISAPKEKFITKESGHWLTSAQAIRLNGWLLKKLNITP